MKISQIIAAALFGSALVVTLPACEKQGPVEEAGEKVDETVEDAGDAIDDAGDAR